MSMTSPSVSAVYNLLVLDESGSMNAVRHVTLAGFNEIVQTIRGAQEQFPEQKQFVSFVTFNGLGIKTLLDKQPASQLTELGPEQYCPDASTPLYDALGRSLLRLELQLEGESNPTVLVSVLTDGEENASREFTSEAVRAMVQRLETAGWSFTYMGANHAVEAAAARIAIRTTTRFRQDAAGMQALFEREKKGRASYYEKKRSGLSSREAEEGYYDQP